MTIINPSNLQLQVGGAGEKTAVFSLISVHVAVSFPIRSSLESHVYVALSPMEVPENKTLPFIGSPVKGHIAESICIS